jgi:hypothetical protein
VAVSTVGGNPVTAGVAEVQISLANAAMVVTFAAAQVETQMGG